MSHSFIPFNLPSIGEEEIREVEATLRSGWITTGARTAQFEKDFREYVGAPHALAVNSCTGGLHIALAALGIGPGDEVITTPITFCSTVHTILHVGAKPVLADIGDDGNIDPEQIERAITPRTRAIVPVHLGGLACDMTRIWDIARRHGLFVVEDAAHAAGTHYRGRQIGAANDGGPASDAVAFSFYATKNMTTGEGGMITTPSAALFGKMKMFSLHGMSHDAWDRYTEKGRWYYEVADTGYKYNLSDIASAIGIHQLRKLESFIETRTRYAQIFSDAFREVDEFELPVHRDDSRHCWHLYVLRLNPRATSLTREEFIEELRRRGIGTSVHFIPIQLHPYFARLGLAETPCPRSLDYYSRCVSLPLYPAMTEEQIHHVANSAKEIVAAHNRRSQILVETA
jgi:dTDP-4-amino-4,6-dideoxygalactose transaminase